MLNLFLANPIKFMLLTMGGILVFSIVFTILMLIPKIKKFNRVRQTYIDSLEKLKRNPCDPDLRQQTLHIGREFANAYREFNRGHAYDEASVMNEINAVCARGTGASGNPSFTAEIEKLAKLLATGVITAEEFERGKALFLGAVPDKAASAVELLQNLDALKKKGVLSQSEFNSKKWEILSERLIPGKMQATNMPQQPAAVADHVVVPCPSCEKPMKVPTSASGSLSCPYCQQVVEVE